ncbi:MAG: class I adenylate-forming enzyme family protein [Phycisphaerae bacterium]|nr:class I adenylate-forming enzyme family protein [Phycisphaerae bacterium]
MDPMPQSNLDGYLAAFADPNAPFLSYYSFASDGTIRTEVFTRGQFLCLARQAGGCLQAQGCQPGDRILHAMSRNHYADLAFRLGAVMLGAVPVTVNWQADTAERVLYKISATQPTLLLNDRGFDPEILAACGREHPNLPIIQVEDLPESPALAEEQFFHNEDPEQSRIIIFTSGTTGLPKGVQLPYRSYVANRATFEKLLDIRPDDRFAAVVVNPLHHTNSTAITDWAMRRPGSRLHLIERYSTGYWRILADTAGQGYDRIVAPTVSRHFDFLAELHETDRLCVPMDVLGPAMGQIDFLIGSAPVGPTTIRRLQEFAGHIPTVRFGSTETCLQVLGIPRQLDEASRLACFQRGWNHTWRDEPTCGYYIGRPTPPLTECRIVSSITRGELGFLVDRQDGEPGYLITRGRNVMSGYVGDSEATIAVLPEGWYTGLRDVAFRLRNIEDGEWDYYWMSRDSALLIRGGANYAYDQINGELAEFLANCYELDTVNFDIAVVGLRLDSEHEDTCCVTLEMKESVPQTVQDAIAATFVDKARGNVSKSAKPDRLLLAPVLRNFKGAILVGELKKQFLDAL